MCRASSAVLGLIAVLGIGDLVLGEEVLLRVLGQPVGDLGHLLAEAVDRLLVHVGLSNEFCEGDCSCVWSAEAQIGTRRRNKQALTYRRDASSAQRRRCPMASSCPPTQDRWSSTSQQPRRTELARN